MIFRKNKKEDKVENVPKKKSWKKYFILGFLLIFITAGLVIYRYAQKSAEGVIKPLKIDPLAVSKDNAVPESFMGKYLTFLYSPEYELKSHETAEDSQAIFLERAYISEKTATSKKISLIVRSLPTHNLQNVPDYQMRENTPKKYKKENFSAGSVQGIDFVPAEESQFEKTYFLIHGDYLAILTFMAPALADETLNKEADTITKSISWLK
jgi:hypothetical protein